MGTELRVTGEGGGGCMDDSQASDWSIWGTQVLTTEIRTLGRVGLRGKGRRTKVMAILSLT